MLKVIIIKDNVLKYPFIFEKMLTKFIHFGKYFSYSVILAVIS